MFKISVDEIILNHISKIIWLIKLFWINLWKLFLLIYISKISVDEIILNYISKLIRWLNNFVNKIIFDQSVN